MESLISDVFEKEKKKSPIKEKIQAIEEIKNEEIYYYRPELIHKKISVNERNYFIEVKNESKNFVDETEQNI